MPDYVAVVGTRDLAQKLSLHLLMHFIYCRVGLAVLSLHPDLVGINEHDGTEVVRKTCTVQPDPHLALLEQQLCDKTSGACARILYRAAYVQGIALAVKEHQVICSPIIIHPNL